MIVSFWLIVDIDLVKVFWLLIDVVENSDRFFLAGYLIHMSMYKVLHSNCMKGNLMDYDDWNIFDDIVKCDVLVCVLNHWDHVEILRLNLDDVWSNQLKKI